MARKKHIELVRDVDDREVSPVERRGGDGGGGGGNGGDRGTGGGDGWQAALRPRNFDEYIGQRDLIENLRVSVHAAKQGG